MKRMIWHKPQWKYDVDRQIQITKDMDFRVLGVVTWVIFYATNAVYIIFDAIKTLKRLCSMF